MTFVDDLILTLQDHRAKHGNIPVVFEDTELDTWEETFRVRVVPAHRQDEHNKVIVISEGSP